MMNTLLDRLISINGRLLALSVLCLLSLAVAQAQPDAWQRQESMRLFGHKNAHFRAAPQQLKPAKSGQRRTTTRSKPNLQDTAQCALYMYSVKQHGWTRGLGKPITEEHARHLPSYLRFSRKNKAGHWTRVENLNGRGQLENNNMSTYLLNPFYDGDADSTDPEWVKKLKTVVRWEFVDDESGRHCIRENAFDAKGNLVYSYIPIPVGENRYMGHYVDAWGQPARFRGSTGAQFVVVQWDENGYEAEISYIGKDGFPKPNIWGEYMTRQEHDKNGFVTRKMSCAPDGSFMIDASGNSGQTTISDDYGNELITTNVDVLGRAIRIPVNDQNTSDFIQRRAAYDKWQRKQRVTYHLADGTPDTTSTGVHGYEVSYNDHGQQTSTRYIDLKGRPRNISYWCSVRRDYDQWGNTIFFELTDQDGHFINNSSNVCLFVSRFEQDVCIEDRNYQTSNGSDTLLASHMMRDGNIRTYRYPFADECDTYIEDEDGEVIEKICSHLDGTPKTDRDWGYHRFVNHKTCAPGVCTEDKQWLDTLGHLVAVPDSAFGQDYNHEVIVSDTLHHLLTIRRLIGDKIVYQIEQSRTDDFNVPLGQNGMDIMGRRARTCLENNLYYNSYVGQTRTSQGYGCMAVINEYGEPAYVRSDDWSWRGIWSFRERDGVNRDETGKAITEDNNFGSKLPRAYIIEGCDSVAERYGIRSGDVIMQYGTWSYPAPNAADSVGKQLRMAAFSQRDVAKSMVVMRYNPATNSSDVITIKLGAGMPHDFGFFVHAFPYTRAEAQRYKRLYSSHFAGHASDTSAISCAPQSHAVATFMRPFRAEGYKQNVFGRGVVDDAIVLGKVALADDGKVVSRGVADSICIKTGRYYDYDGDYDYCRRLWFTTDMKTVRSLDFKPGEWTDAEFWQANIDERVSVPCRPLYDQTRRLMDAYVDSLKQARRDSLVRLYGAAADAVVNDSICMIIADVEGGDTGYMVKNGYQGRFVILEWCGWKCTDTFEAFKRVFEQNKDKKKDILLLSVGDNGLEEVVRVKTKKKFMGLRIRSGVFSFDVFKLVYDKYSQYCEQQE